MDKYRAWFKAETDTFKETYCAQVDNYYDLVLSQIEAITSRPGDETTMKLSQNRISNLTTLYEQQLTWLSRRYFDSKPTFDAISSAINDTTSVTNPITPSHLNTRDSYQVDAFAENSTNQPQLANIRKRFDATVGMPKYSDGGFLRFTSTLSDHQFVSRSSSNHNIDSQTTLPSPSVSSKAPSEQSQKSMSVGQSGNQNDSDTTLPEEHQWESELDPNCDCKDCQPDSMQIKAESNSSEVVVLESDNSKATIATSPNGSNRLIKNEFAFERQFEFNSAQLTSDTENDNVVSSSGGQVNGIEEAKLIEMKAHTQQPPEQASLGVFKRTLSTPVPTGSTVAKRTRGVPGKGHTCATCGQSFVTNYLLERHIRTHTQERPYACEQCDRTFTRKDNLHVHLLTHSGTMKGRCTWPGCTFQASKSSNVVMHIRTVHFKLPPTKTKQLQLGLVDDRDAREYLEKM